MITQFDHLTLSTPSFDAHRKLLSHLGYVERFVERTIRNPNIKRTLVGDFKEFHALALFDAPQSLSIEIVDQGAGTDIRSTIFPIFENVPSPLIESLLGAKLRIGGRLIRKAKLIGLEAPIYVQNTASGPIVCDSFVMNVQNLSSSLLVWKVLGCGVSMENDYATLTFRSPLHGFTASLFLIEDTEMEPVPLDAYGFNYAALISTSARKEKMHLEKEGFLTTSLEEHSVNGKMLELFFITGPRIQAVEILGLH